MTSPEFNVKTVFRTCVVHAARRGEALMTQVLQKTVAALMAEESSAHIGPSQRQWITQALQQLQQHEAAMVKAYPLALVEAFAQGPGVAQAQPATATGMDFGEFSIMDDAQVQAQVELARAQQMATHTTDEALAELNALVSSAQGLPSVQPERNPLRPESYIRALQQVVGQTGIVPQVREIWMRYLREPLSSLLTQEYKDMVESLRQQGVQPAGYAKLATAGMARPAMPSVQGGPYSAGHNTGYGTGYGGLVPEHAAQEALLSVQILRQMLAAQSAESRRMALSGQAPLSMHAGAYSAQTVAEAWQDMAELERLVGRLTQSQALQPPGMPYSGMAPVSAVAALDPASVYAMVQEAPPPGAPEVVSRMLDYLVHSARALPAVQRAFRHLEPALQQLVRHDSSFFADDQHPARRLLDAVAERSRVFESENTTGFSRFMRVVDEAVAHISGQDIRQAQPFIEVLAAMQSAWAGQAQRDVLRQQAQAQAMQKIEQRAKLAAQISAGVRKLSETAQVPADIMEFAAGPWAEVAALAHMEAIKTGTPQADPGGYLALVPELFWSVQPQQVGQNVEHLQGLLPGLQERLRQGLGLLGRTPAQIQAFLQRLQQRHAEIFRAAQAARSEQGQQAALAASAAPTQPAAIGLDLDFSRNTPVPAEMPSPHPDFKIGVWVEIFNQRYTVRTQLTWSSPNKTLFLFTAPDGSTQSMTRRMCVKLIAEGNLRVIG